MAVHCSPDLPQERFRGAALHDTGEFDIIAGALQMRVPRRRLIGWAGGLIVLISSLSVCVPTGQALDGDDPSSSRTAIMRALRDVQSQYGADAVMIEGHLLAHAIQGGSILEAVVSVAGTEERGGKKFLAFKVDTGIIYNDQEIAAPGRTARVWRDIAEATLRKFRTLTLPADGIVLIIGYSHKPYLDEADLRARLNEGHGAPEVAAFYLSLSDVAELMAERISAQQLIDRSTVLLDGMPVRLTIDAPTPAP